MRFFFKKNLTFEQLAWSGTRGSSPRGCPTRGSPRSGLAGGPGGGKCHLHPSRFPQNNKIKIYCLICRRRGLRGRRVGPHGLRRVWRGRRRPVLAVAVGATGAEVEEASAVALEAGGEKEKKMFFGEEFGTGKRYFSRGGRVSAKQATASVPPNPIRKPYKFVIR